VLIVSVFFFFFFLHFISPRILFPDGLGKRVVQFDSQGQALIEHGKEEIRYEQEPFPLHPGEVLQGKVQALPVVSQNQALRLKAKIDCTRRVRVTMTICFRGK
jgi:hypothetical protein